MGPLAGWLFLVDVERVLGVVALLDRVEPVIVAAVGRFDSVLASRRWYRRFIDDLLIRRGRAGPVCVLVRPVIHRCVIEWPPPGSVRLGQLPVVM